MKLAREGSFPSPHAAQIFDPFWPKELLICALGATSAVPASGEAEGIAETLVKAPKHNHASARTAELENARRAEGFADPAISVRC